MNASNESFRITDPDLSYIAANAALEIDELINGEETDLSNLELLSERLKKSTLEANDAGLGTKRFIDPVSSDVFSRAFSVTYNSNINSLEDLFVNMGKLAAEMSELESSGDNLPALMRDFCVALSKYTLASNSHMSDRRARYPFRR